MILIIVVNRYCKRKEAKQMDETKKLQILSDLVSIQSVNGHERPVAEYLKTLFDKAGIKNQILPFPNESDRANFVAELGSGEPILAVSGHMDVVSADASSWETDPFKLTKKGDKLYGRGATDMKSGLAALVIAMLELKTSDQPINGTIRLLATAGEEIGQPGAELLQKQGYIDDIDGLLIGEPSANRAVFANDGELDISIHSHGKTAHSSTPAVGNNAVEHLLDVLEQIRHRMTQLMANTSNKVLGQTIFNVDVLNGGSQYNAIPAEAFAGINIRTIPELPNAKILDELQHICDDYNSRTNGDVSLKVEMNIVPILGDAHSKLIQLIQRIGTPFVKSGKILPQPAIQHSNPIMPFSLTGIDTMGASGGTDASKFLVNHTTGANFVVFGPGNDNSHQDNEFVSEQMYLSFIEIYKQLLTVYFNN